MKYGTFTRTFTLPEDVDPKSVKGSFKDGVLELSIPRKEAPKKDEPIEVKID
jgi:HSP20 family protein